MLSKIKIASIKPTDCYGLSRMEAASFFLFLQKEKKDIADSWNRSL